MADAASDIALELARFLCDLFHGRQVNSTVNGESGTAAFFTEDAQIAYGAALLRPHVWEWIPVGERLPESNVPVLILTTPRQHRYVAEFNETFQEWIDPDKSWWIWRLRKAQVTHWAALPSAPLSLESKGETK